MHFIRTPSLPLRTKEYIQCSLIGEIKMYFWDKTKSKVSKSTDHYLLRIWVFFDISANEQLTLERYSFRHLAFLILEIRVAPTINWYLFHVHIFFSNQLFPERWIQINTRYELSIKRQSKSTKTCRLHSSLNFFYQAVLQDQRVPTDQAK